MDVPVSGVEQPAVEHGVTKHLAAAMKSELPHGVRLVRFDGLDRNLERHGNLLMSLPECRPAQDIELTLAGL